MENHTHFMKQALELAKEAAAAMEVPVGALVVHNGEIIGRGRNKREATQDPVSHAEILAIQEAAHTLGSFRLEETVLYVTLEPCPMCAGAILNARIPKVVYGCSDPKAGAVQTLYTLLEDDRLNHQCEVICGVLEQDASILLSSFFAELRKRKK